MRHDVIISFDMLHLLLIAYCQNICEKQHIGFGWVRDLFAWTSVYFFQAQSCLTPILRSMFASEEASSVSACISDLKAAWLSHQGILLGKPV